MKVPRDYQTWAHNATVNFILNPANWTGGVATDGKGPKYPLVVEATGLGKSLNIAMFIWHALSMSPGARIMQLCHVKELVESNYKELLGMWPAAPAGIYAAGLNRKDTRSQVTFAMINSVSKRAATFGKIDFVLIDECHRLSNNDKTMYGKFLTELRKKNPNLIVIGYTATDYRMQGGKLTDMGLFDEVVFDIGSGESFLWAVDQGYLIMPVPTDPGFQLDDSGIELSGGDYKQSAASQALRDQDIIERAIDYSIALAKEEGRKRALAFAQSIEDAELIADILTYKGYPTEAVHSQRSDRDEVLAAHKRGDLWGVSNKDILTTGYNDPVLDLMINLRLTRSPGLWVQMVGRMTRPNWTNHFFGHNGGPPLDDEGRFNIGTREGRLASIAASGKLNARVLDFTGNTERLGPINYPNLPKRRGAGGGEPPVRTCNGTTDEGREAGMKCAPATFHHVSVKICPHCGYEWPEESKIGGMASNKDLVSPTNPLGLPAPKMIEKTYEVFSVHEMTAVKHNGKVLTRDDEGNVLEKKPDTVKVSYRCGYRSFNTWVCFAHKPKSFPRRRAEGWWSAHGGQGDAPFDIDEAVEMIGDLKRPKFIKVCTSTEFPEIESYDFVGTKFVLDLTGEVEIHDPEPDPMEKVIESASTAQFYAGGSGYYDDDIPF
jgi:DNA repair protein RadD